MYELLYKQATLGNVYELQIIECLQHLLVKYSTLKPI